MEPILELNHVLHIGMIDADAFDQFKAQQEAYFKRYHTVFWDSEGYAKKRVQFRGEALDEWISPQKIEGNNIKRLQTFLQKHGFMPGARIDGIFGYWTLASVRLFQEYIRTIEGINEVGIPDGKVFKGTHQHMLRWEEQKLYAKWGPNKVSETDPKAYEWTTSTPEYDLWMALLEKTKAHYLALQQAAPEDSDDLEVFQLRELEKYANPTDTRKIADWTFDRKEIHLIGLRCQHEKEALERGNDDLFVLLMNGMVFKFWGSTDPRPKVSLANEPYLIEGQHKYRLAWHKVKSAGKKVYKALRPYDHGVLVYRDWNQDNALSDEDIRKGLSFNPTPRIKELNNPNTTINIHWTFDGQTNWSAGCQVISGRSYVNNMGEIINCSTFSAGSYETLSFMTQKGFRRNCGAYTFLSDFVFAYGPPNTDHVVYTLGRDGLIEQLADNTLLDLLVSQRVLKHLKKEESGREAFLQDLVSLLKKPSLLEGLA
ncbi:MAG: peptidoglycan-binding domain-containing protein [Saprospiraceae bacterium]